MKRKPLTGFLVVVLVACALWTTWIATVFTYSTKKTLMISRQLDYLDGQRLIVQALANETLVYSQKHPGIDPILQKYDIKASNAPVILPVQRQPSK